MAAHANVAALISEDLRLSQKERLFATLLAEGKRADTASLLAGYKDQTGRGKYGYELAQKPRILEYARKLRAKNEQMMDMSRKRVMDGFIEAIEQAKLMSEPMSQISGWREIAKMCGYYAPEVKKIDINISSQRVLSQLETLSDADLLELIEKDAETIEGEARELLDAAESDGIDDSEAGSETASGAGEPGTGEEEPDPLRQADVPPLHGGVGA